jgi:competence protein ComFC
MTYQKYVNNSKKFLLDLFFPAFCFGCQKEGTYLCQDCLHILEISEHNYCLCNKTPLKIPAEQKKNGKCNRCSDKKLSGLFFALSYKEKTLARKLIHDFKYEPYVKNLAETLAKILIQHFILTKRNSNDIWEESILIPVPLGNKKIRERGYNQSEELAKELAKIIKIPVLTNVLIKTKKTPSQVGLSEKQRAENLKGAFAVSTTNLLKNKKIFLVDDVYTTGSTMSECADVLKKAGAKQVWGIALAREN